MIVVLVQVLGTPGSLELAPPLPDPTLQYGAWLGLACDVRDPLRRLLVAMRGRAAQRASAELPTSTGRAVSAPVAVETLPAPRGRLTARRAA